MKKIVFSFLAVLSFGIVANAQFPAWVEDSVSVGPGYGDDVYYSMQNSTQRTESNLNWHIGFSMSAADSSAIWANHNGGTNFVKVFNTQKDSSQWATVALSDTATTSICYNNDQGWYQGAFNDIPSADPFDFGWGVYNTSNHTIFGNTIFIVRANGVYYKVLFQTLESLIMKYTFKVGDFAGNTTQYTVAKTPNYSNNLFAYFNLATGADTNREPNITDWDIQFTRYTTDDPFSGSLPHNTVVGVLKNRGVNIVQANQLHVDSAFADNATFVGNWNPAISAIGYNWKTFDLANFVYVVPDSNSYFVEGKDGVVYQLQFTSFAGSSTGKINFRKRTLGPLSVADVNSTISEYKFYPIPAQNELNLLLSSKEATKASVQLVDMNGRTITQIPVQLKSGLNAYKIPTQNLAAGSYIIKINGSNISIAEHITIQK